MIPSVIYVQGASTADWAAALSAIGGAILGALVGGAISWWVQKNASRQIIAMEEAARINHSRALAIKVMVRASLVLNDVASTVESIDRSLSRANSLGLTSSPLWARIAPIVGSAKVQPFNVDDLMPFFDAQKYDVVHGYIEIMMQHEVLNNALEAYALKRSNLNDVLPVGFKTSDGALGWEPKNDLERLKVEPYVMEVSALADSLRSLSNNLNTRSKEVCQIIGDAGVAMFGASFPRVALPGKNGQG